MIVRTIFFMKTPLLKPAEMPAVFITTLAMALAMTQMA
jgi:hypothetical protein